MTDRPEQALIVDHDFEPDSYLRFPLPTRVALDCSCSDLRPLVERTVGIKYSLPAVLG